MTASDAERLTTPSSRLFEREEIRAELLSHGPAVIAVHSQKNLSRDKPSDDSAAVIVDPEGALVLLVADGFGGTRGGGQAGVTAVQCVRDAVLANDGATDVRERILQGLEAANREIVGQGIGAATTAACAVIQAGELRSLHVGDSAVLVVGQRGKIKLQTVSHSPVGYAQEAGILDEEEALFHEDRHLVSNFVGSPDMTTDIGPPLSLAARDTVLIASDGLLDNLRMDEIVAIVRKGRLAQVAEELVRTATERMRQIDPTHPSKPDDLTFVLYRPTSG